MAYTITNVLAYSDTTNGTSGAKTYTTSASSAPDTNGQLVLDVSVSSTVAIADSNIGTVTDSSSDGITWLLQKSAVNVSGAFLVWTGKYIADRKCTNATRTFTIPVTGLSLSNPSGICVNCDSVGGLSAWGSTLIRGSGKDSGNTNVHPNPALGANALTTSIIHTACSENWQTGPQDTVPTGFTQSAWVTHALPAHGLISGYKNGGFTSSALTWTGTGPGNFGWSATAIEIDTTVGTVVALTGLSQTDSGGTLTPGSTVPLGGLQNSMVAGTPAASITIQLSGLGATMSAGTMAPGATIPLTGKQDTMSGGILAPSSAVPVTGLSQTDSAGTFTPGSTVPLGGLQDSMAAGTLAPGSTAPMSGLQDSMVAGVLSVSSSVVVPGLQQTAQQGTPIANIGVALQGQQQTAQQGTLTPNFFVRLVGQLWTWIQGVLTYSFQRSPDAQCALLIQADGVLRVPAFGPALIVQADGRLTVPADGRWVTIPDEDMEIPICLG